MVSRLSFKALVLAIAAGAAVSACSIPRVSPYRIDVRQGNYVTQEMVSQLKPGMTRDQVRFILGSPLVSDVFHDDRWDYVYRFQPGRGEGQQRRLTVLFADGRLARLAGDVVAAEPGAPAPSENPVRPQVIDIGGSGAEPAGTESPKEKP